MDSQRSIPGNHSQTSTRLFLFASTRQGYNSINSSMTVVRAVAGEIANRVYIPILISKLCVFRIRL